MTPYRILSESLIRIYSYLINFGKFKEKKDGFFSERKQCAKSVQIRIFFWTVFFRIRTKYRDLQSKNTGKY